MAGDSRPLKGDKGVDDRLTMSPASVMLLRRHSSRGHHELYGSPDSGHHALGLPRVLKYGRCMSVGRPKNLARQVDDFRRKSLVM
jgi:hypothetical protein